MPLKATNVFQTLWSIQEGGETVGKGMKYV
jgi:hypothetical protein